MSIVDIEIVVSIRCKGPVTIDQVGIASDDLDMVCAAIS